MSLAGGVLTTGGFGRGSDPSLGRFSILGLYLFNVNHGDNPPPSGIPPG